MLSTTFISCSCDKPLRANKNCVEVLGEDNELLITELDVGVCGEYMLYDVEFLSVRGFLAGDTCEQASCVIYKDKFAFKKTKCLNYVLTFLECFSGEVRHNSFGSLSKSLFLGVDLKTIVLLFGLSLKLPFTGVWSLLNGPCLLPASMSGLHVTGKCLLPLC